MPAFNAGTVVEPLDYDFRTKDNPNGKYGTVKEPTDRQLAEYLAGVKNLVAQFKGQIPEGLITGNPDVGELMDAVEDLDPEIVVTFHASLAGLFAELCSGEPSREDIIGLPIRIRGMFYTWLQREVMAPEAAPGGGSNVTTLRAAAG